MNRKSGEQFFLKCVELKIYRIRNWVVVKAAMPCFTIIVGIIDIPVARSDENPLQASSMDYTHEFDGFKLHKIIQDFPSRTGD